MEKDVFITLGSNVGDRELYLLRGIAALGTLPTCRITGLSSFYDTEPVGEKAQDNFLNAVVRLETDLSPADLLKALQRLETEQFGRKRTAHWGPRTMDLDILFFGDAVIKEEGLTIPHPRLHERRFVLVPLAEIAHDFVHPILKKTVKDILSQLKSTDRVTKI